MYLSVLFKNITQCYQNVTFKALENEVEEGKTKEKNQKKSSLMRRSFVRRLSLTANLGLRLWWVPAIRMWEKTMHVVLRKN